MRTIIFACVFVLAFCSLNAQTTSTIKIKKEKSDSLKLDSLKPPVPKIRRNSLVAELQYTFCLEKRPDINNGGLISIFYSRGNPRMRLGLESGYGIIGGDYGAILVNGYTFIDYKENYHYIPVLARGYYYINLTRSLSAIVTLKAGASYFTTRRTFIDSNTKEDTSELLFTWGTGIHFFFSKRSGRYTIPIGAQYMQIDKYKFLTASVLIRLVNW